MHKSAKAFTPYLCKRIVIGMSNTYKVYYSLLDDEVTQILPCKRRSPAAFMKHTGESYDDSDLRVSADK